MAPIGLREHLRTRPTQSSPEHEQLHSPKLELGRRQTGRRQQAAGAGGGRWATVSLGVLSARLPYKGNETLSTPMFVVCDCWRRCRLCMCLATWPWLMLRPFRQLLMGPRTCPQRETNKQTVRQTGRETDKETQQQQTQFAIEAATIGGSNGGNNVAAATDQEWAWASGVDLCVPHEERSRVRPQSR